jgi:Ca2+-binding RTX toxin-like protein
MIVDGPATAIGNTASLRIAHTGLWLGTTDPNNTRGRIAIAAQSETQELNPLYSADYTALLGITDSDLRGLGYGMELGQPMSQHVRYLGSDAIGALSTNKETGNDVIFAGAGDDIVIAGDGNDNVAGYEGDDYITGGAGNDVLVGDSFVMGAGDGFSTTPNLDLYTAKLLINGYSIDTSQHGRDMISGGSGNFATESIAYCALFKRARGQFIKMQAANNALWRIAA